MSIWGVSSCCFMESKVCFSSRRKRMASRAFGERSSVELVRREESWSREVGKVERWSSI